MKHLQKTARITAWVVVSLIISWAGLSIAHGLVPHQCPKQRGSHRCVHKDGSPTSIGPNAQVSMDGCTCLAWCFLHGQGIPTP